MKKLLRQVFRISPENELLDHECSQPPRKKKSGRLSRQNFTLGALGISAVLLCLCVYLILDTITLGAGAAIDSFGPAKDEAANEVYQIFYDQSFKVAEEAHHVSNNASISIGNLHEVQKLEVLKVSDVSYETPNPEDQGWFADFVESIVGILDADMVSWLEVPGSGVFTVNLQASEFIIDEERQYVLIRVPNPELAEFTIDYENVELLLFEKGGAFKNSAKYGADLAVEQLQNAELTMMQNVNDNQTFHQKAKDATINMLVNLVKQLNPQLPDLVVEVEFIS